MEVFLYRVHFCCRFVMRPFILCCVELWSHVLATGKLVDYIQATDRPNSYNDNCIVHVQKYQRVF